MVGDRKGSDAVFRSKQRGYGEIQNAVQRFLTTDFFASERYASQIVLFFRVTEHGFLLKFIRA